MHRSLHVLLALAVCSSTGCGSLMGLDFEAPDKEQNTAPITVETDQKIKKETTPLGHIRRVATGNYDSAVIMNDGAVWVWGWNAAGELGLGKVARQLVPVRAGQLTTGARLEDFDLGKGHGCSADVAGQIACLGDGENGQLGSKISESLTPVGVPMLLPMQKMGSTHLAVASDYACAARIDLSVWCWGNNDNGQLGTGTTDIVSGPVQVSQQLVSGGTNMAVGIGLGERHGCAVLAPRNEVFCWGDNSDGQLGSPRSDGPREPQLVPDVKDVLKVVAGNGFSCVLNRDSTVTCWGDNAYGQLGAGDFRKHVDHTQVQKLVDVQDIVAGAAHVCALTTSGEVHCWGANLWGQLGTGDQANAHSKVRVGNLPVAVGIVAGPSHTCAWSANDEVFCWGANNGGQLGTGDTLDRLSPTRVARSW